METKRLTEHLSVAGQLTPEDMAAAKATGFRAVVVNRPDGEGADQPTFPEIEAAARAAGLEVRYLPVVSGRVTDEDALAFGRALDELPKPVLGFCRTGTRTATLWALSEARRRPLPDIVARAKAAGYDMAGVVRRLANNGKTPTDTAVASHEVVIVGGGAGGAAVAASLLARAPGLDVAIVEPADVHYYQPGWTLVGGGVFDARVTRKDMGATIPRGVAWLKAAVAAFEPEDNAVILEGCHVVRYRHLIVAPGLKLDWARIEGLEETLGRNGVTSNYRYDLAPYTWRLVEGLKGGSALFTQPPMPIKCAGAPQKAMYLSADHWRRGGVLNDVEIAFCTAGPALFGVADYVPALMKYVEAYNIDLKLKRNLVAIDGPARRATFEEAKPDGTTARVEMGFDLIHVCPPQTAPDFVRVSPLADAAGWLDVDPGTLRHRRHANVYGLGDVTGCANAKTAAAARKQAPVVAENVLLDRGGKADGRRAVYDGYGSCPLTVERGKIVLAEFGYGGKRLPSFPSWLIKDTEPSRLAWFLKERMLPPIYWQAMLKGREPMAKPAFDN